LSGNVDSLIAEDSAAYYMNYGYGITGAWLVEKMLYEGLYSDTSVLNNDSLMAAFYARVDSSDKGAILQSEFENMFLTDSNTLSDGKVFSAELSLAQYLNSIVPDSNSEAYNYQTVNNIYLQMLSEGVDTFTAAQIEVLDSIALLCPYVGGDAVYTARALYAMYDNTVFFDDDSLCQPIDSPELRSLQVANNLPDTNKVAPVEFVKLYPNPTKETLNLIYQAQTQGQVEFVLTDQLGQTVFMKPLGSGQTFAQFSVENLSSGIYYWKLKDSERTIKTGKVAIIQ
jgi:hypothetical protein